MTHEGNCGCCAGVTSQTPEGKANRPGLPAIVYRAGTYGTFRSTLLARLSSAEHPALRNLTTRRADDWTIGLCDAFAVMGDVITFYQERIANEAFLRTAVERRSILELARLVGYQLAPGVAASTSLAFTLDAPLTQPAPPALPVAIPPGTRVQSVPGPDELPQTFETIEEIVARVEWNDVGVQTSVREHVHRAQTSLWLEGTSTLLQPGDAIALIGAHRRTEDSSSGKWEVRWIEHVEVDNQRGLTRVDWTDPLQQFASASEPDAEGVEIYALRLRAALFGHNAIDPNTIDFMKIPAKQWEAVVDRNATSEILTWKGFGDALTNPIDLDAVYPKIVKGGWLALAAGATTQLYRVRSVQQASQAKFGLTGKVSRITLDTDHNLAKFNRRDTSVLGQSEPLQLAPRPVVCPVFGQRLPLGSVQSMLTKGRGLAVEGKRQRLVASSNPTGVRFPDDPGRKALPHESFVALGAPQILVGASFAPADPEDLDDAAAHSATFRWTVLDRQGLVVIVEGALDALALQPALERDPYVSEIAFIAEGADAVTHDRDRTTVALASALVHCYDRGTVRVNANVARATHGETVGEIAGAGEASLPNQSFQLRQAPLTYVAARNPQGCKATLEVRVNDLLWTEVPSLFEQPPTARVYSLRQDDAGNTIVQFGDGTEGARLPTGPDNIRMAYRKGIGAAGNVRAGTLSSLLSRPLGVKAAINPVAAVGGEDPESQEDARRNAPNSVLTLERAVSILDYADFSRAFAGIAKAVAAWIPAGRARGVHITVAAVEGAAIAPGSEPYDSLLDALRAYGDALLPLTLSSYQAAHFALSLKVKVGPGFVAEQVLQQVTARLKADFAFDARDFGQPATLDEIMATAHAVAGVLAVDVDAFHRTGTTPGPQPQPRIFPRPATLQPDGAVTAAELLMLDPETLTVSAMS